MKKLLFSLAFIFALCSCNKEPISPEEKDKQMLYGAWETIDCYSIQIDGRHDNATSDKYWDFKDDGMLYVNGLPGRWTFEDYVLNIKFPNNDKLTEFTIVELTKERLVMYYVHNKNSETKWIKVHFVLKRV